MKLSPRDAAAYFRKPDPDRPGVLIFGQDPMRVALRRAEVVKALTGPAAEEEMRLTRLTGADLRGDAAALIDAVKAIGFFPGPRAVVVEDATETTLPALQAALDDWRPGDATLVVTAGALRKESKLRKLFEGHRTALAAAIYDDPPARADVERMLGDAGLPPPPRDAVEALMALAQGMGPGDLTQLVAKIGLYKLGDPAPLTPADIAACAPLSVEAAVDDLIDVVADCREDRIDPVLSRLRAQGQTAVGICIAAGRHFNLLYRLAGDPGGPEAGAGRVRPPLFGPRRDRLVRQARSWGAMRLEEALTLIVDTDLALRSAAQTAPQMALVERMLLRLSRLGQRR